MKSYIISTCLTIYLLTCISSVNAQTDSTNQGQLVYDFVEQMPEFPGGVKELYAYIADSIVYPELAQESCIYGTVYLKFIVRYDGSISDVALLRDIGAGCGEEAIRVVRSMPNWQPGKQNGKPVDVYFKLPIYYEPSKKCRKEANN